MLLYVSFCEAGCATFDRGVVMEFDPSTGAMLGGLFGVSGTNTIIGGLVLSFANTVTYYLSWFGDVICYSGVRGRFASDATEEPI